MPPTTGHPVAGNTAPRPALRPDYSPAQLRLWLARHEEFCIEARRGAVDVVFLGDSLMEHWSTCGLAAWQTLLGPLRALNLGLAGDRTQQVLWRIAHGELDGLDPIVTCVLIGTNNLDPGLGADSLSPRNTPAEIIAGIEAVVAAVARALPRTTIVLHALLPRGEPASAARVAVTDINRALGDRARCWPRVQFIDVGPTMLEPDGTPGAVFRPDLLHVSEAGYSRWAEALAAVFRELGLRPRGRSRLAPAKRSSFSA